MKNIILVVITLLCSASLSFGQLTIVAPNGDVGVGTDTPSEKLDVDGNIIIPNNSYYLSFRDDGITPHQAFGMDSNNDIVFNRSAIVDDLTSGLIFGAANKNIDFRNKDNNSMLRIRANGRIGIGVNVPSETLHVNGNVLATNVSVPSDKRLKDNASNFEYGLDEVLKLNTIKYYYNGEAGIDSDEQQFGVYAQELQKIAPLLVGDLNYVEEDQNGKRIKSETYLKINDSSIKWMLVNAIQEQQEIIESKDDVIQELEDRIGHIENLLERYISNEDHLNTTEITFSSQPELSQNVPNPFNEETIVNYFIPSNAKNAYMQIFDLSGKMIKNVNLEKGKGQLIIKAGELKSNTYTYSLIIDGKLEYTKKMILTK